MPTFDLKTQEGLQQACRHLADHPPADLKKWTGVIQDFLLWLQSTNLQQRSTLEFHARLWDDNPISSVGQGQIQVGVVTDQEAFRTWLAEVSFEQLPAERADRLPRLTEIYREMVQQFETAGSRVPHLKIFRVLAALFPEDFTTITDRGALEKLIRAMGRARGVNPVERHFFVRNRIDEVIDHSSTTLEDRVYRLALPWYVYELSDREEPEEEKVSKPGPKPGEEILLPLPAARRRRGLTAIAGGFPTVLTILESVKEGVTRQDLLDCLRGINPNLKDNSLGVTINVLRSELGVLKVVNGEYQLTDRGSRALESSDASDLSDWLLTRILGVDHVLKLLVDGPRSRPDLLAYLQKVNPGWTTDYAPTAMLTWLLSMKALRREPDGKLALDAAGEDWAARIKWDPEFLVLENVGSEPPTPDSVPTGGAPLPPLKAITASVKKEGSFSVSMVEQLHLGLWSPQLRHFAVLAGISGSGKTLLARAYARAIQGADPEAGLRVLLEPVQPGWYDPTPLLGYLNPMGQESYVRTPFLEFLLRASQDPTHPYVLILDEMNLSRPEQYFAPLLSRMETGGAISLHSEGEIFDGVPGTVPYPSNLAIIGTVNMDETTHGLSDKVLDRAFTLEFWEVDLDTYPHWAEGRIPPADEAVVRALLGDLMKALSPARLHFGWRVVEDIMRMLETARKMEATTSFLELLDSIMLAKLLPKLRGEDSERFQSALVKAKEAFTKHHLPKSSTRIQQLLEDLARNGSAHFWR